ncbi:MAG: hypothetical protein HN380_20685 [Victivallales bacterium]|nr:hypothetical protein [Victivallales bacterium]
MKTLCWLVAASALSVAIGLAQEPPAAPLLNELMGDIDYARLLRAAKLTPAQLDSLAQAQAAWLDTATATPAVVDSLRDVAVNIALGKPDHEAYQELGELQRDVQEAQTGHHQAQQALVKELTAMFTAEQAEALCLHNSPVSGLQHMVETLGRVRKGPDEMWQRVKRDVTANLARMAAQGGAKDLDREKLATWPDAIKKMSDEEFAKALPTLAAEWAKALVPQMMQRLNNPEAQRELLRGICYRLLTHPTSYDLVQAVIDQRKPPKE